ncbi:hypothetical protein CO172_02315 [Candidatus Uhrbacteria bacterium CG_4_9_14_3_um_filter_36_7]|uniref:PEP-utilising enzyme mobile domain-containing protein n=1 Tax=Candidatus Uhrbacteria bacterium CG_4_9_14_3_um_filter_36_7 TaxID=1975033 RepID=A0A2M7XHD3_9BACT|nr:MAG: hypothetical protein CO172_02315 [Candidatus Uhrbacteria bacterium CG_4_9_14_3_um_filter_36_7]
MRQWQEDERAFDDYFYAFAPQRLLSLSDQELFQEFECYHNLSKKRFTSSSIIDHFALGTDQKIADLLRLEAGPFEKESNFTNVFSIATAPVHQSFINEAEISLLRIAILVQSGKYIDDPDIIDLLTIHKQAFFWTKNNYRKAQVLSLDHFKEEIAAWLRTGVDLKEMLKKIEGTSVANQEAKEQLFASYPLRPILLRLLKISEDFTRWQDERKRATYFSIHLGTMLMSEMAKRRGVDPELTKQMLLEEVGSWFIDNTLGIDELRERQNRCVAFWKEGETRVYTGSEEFDGIHSILLGENKEDDAQDLRGLVACLGRARGTARIVKSVEEISKVQDGDILVAVMTRPDYVVAMKKAAAIVTDEGGITSHAAIVSRELGVPCIIATKKATKIFKDGDFLEVNAHHNWVRKITTI